MFYKILVNDTKYNFFIKVDFNMNMSLYKPVLAAKRNELSSLTTDTTLLESLGLDIMDKNGYFYIYIFTIYSSRVQLK